MSDPESRTDVLVRPDVDLLLAAYDADDCDDLESTVDCALAVYTTLENKNEILDNIDTVAGVSTPQPNVSEKTADDR